MSHEAFTFLFLPPAFATMVHRLHEAFLDFLDRLDPKFVRRLACGAAIEVGGWRDLWSGSGHVSGQRQQYLRVNIEVHEFGSIVSESG